MENKYNSPERLPVRMYGIVRMLFDLDSYLLYILYPVD